VREKKFDGNVDTRAYSSGAFGLTEAGVNKLKKSLSRGGTYTRWRERPADQLKVTNVTDF